MPETNPTAPTPQPIPPTGCGRCRFWKHKPDAADDGVFFPRGPIEPDADSPGLCLRFPPSTDATVESEPRRVVLVGPRWPLTLAKEWCGEFSPSVASSEGGIEPTVNYRTFFLGLAGRVQTFLSAVNAPNPAPASYQELFRLPWARIITGDGMGRSSQNNLCNRIRELGGEPPASWIPRAAGKKRGRNAGDK